MIWQGDCFSFFFVFNYLFGFFLHNSSGLNFLFPLLRVIQKIIELKPKSKYIVAVDDAKNTLEEVVKVTFQLFCSR